MLVEGGWILLKHGQGKSDGLAQATSVLLRRWLWTVYKASLMFYFGAVATHFSTNVPKYTIGRCGAASGLISLSVTW